MMVFPLKVTFLLCALKMLYSLSGVQRPYAEVLLQFRLLVKEYREIVETDQRSLRVTHPRKSHDVIFRFEVGLLENADSILIGLGRLSLILSLDGLRGCSWNYCTFASSLHVTEENRDHYVQHRSAARRTLTLQKTHWEGGDS